MRRTTRPIESNTGPSSEHVAPPPAPDREVRRVLDLLDEALREFHSRDLVAGTEVVDALLDLRREIERPERSGQQVVENDVRLPA